MGRTALVIIGQRVGSVLAPLQLGDGIPHGCEIAARISHLAMQARQADNLVLLFLTVLFGRSARCMVTSADGISSTQRRPLAVPSLEVSIPSSMIRNFLRRLNRQSGCCGSRRVFETCRLILSLDRADTVLHQFGVERNGIVIMPIGTEHYRREQVFKITHAATSVIPALMKLLRHCVSARAAGYIARISEIGTNMDAFMEFDAAINSFILSIA